MDPQLTLHLTKSAELVYQLGSLKAQSTNDKAKLSIQNTTLIEYQVFWIDYQNQLKSYGEIKPQESFQVNSFRFHSFLLKTKEGRVCCSYTLHYIGIHYLTILSDMPFQATISVGTPHVQINPTIIEESDRIKCRIFFTNYTSSSLSLEWAKDATTNEDLDFHIQPNEKERTLTTYTNHHLILKQKETDVLRWCLRKAMNISIIALPSVDESSIRYIIQPIDCEIVPCTVSYHHETIQGFSIHIDKEIVADIKEELQNAIEQDLSDIKREIPSNVFHVLQNTSIWINHKIRFGLKHQSDQWGGLCYHPSQEWLNENGNCIEKVKSIEIYQVSDYLTMRLPNEPSVLMHELAHAFHDYINFERDDIKEAYEKAIQHEKYLQVQNTKGDTVRAYAATNHHEYFAEISEAYFGRCNYFPFVRNDLEDYDPDGFKLVEKLWFLSAEAIENEHKMS